MDADSSLPLVYQRRQLLTVSILVSLIGVLNFLVQMSKGQDCGAACVTLTTNLSKTTVIPTNLTRNQSMAPTMNQSVIQSESQSMNHTVKHTMDQTVSQTVNQTVNYAMNQTANQADQTMKKSVSNVSHKEAENNRGASPRLWIHVQKFGEGMGNWRLAFAELVLTARSLNATLVEPCILQGRLKSCSLVRSSPDKWLRFSDMFDMRIFKAIHPYIVQQEEYNSLVDPMVSTWCMHAGNPPVQRACNTKEGVLENYHRNKTIAPLDKAMQSVRDKNQSRDVVAQIYLYRRGGFQNTKFENQVMLDRNETSSVATGSYHFRAEQYARVDDLLKQMGVKGEFNVIHWRAELASMDQKKCVEQLIRSKELLESNATMTPTILMSSLSTDEDKTWMAGRQQAGKNESLTTLKRAGFLKLDSVASKSNDLFHLAAWDLILAQKAKRFVTCTKACANDHICSACNHRGSFAQTAVDYRSQVKKSSEKCWPVRPAANIDI